MPRNDRNRLTALQVSKLIAAGKPCSKSDGGGLTLTISSRGYGAWVLRYYIDGKRREFTIGPYSDYPLAKAREASERIRRKIDEGVDVAAEKQREKAKSGAGPHPTTFSQLAELWFERTQRERLQHPQVVWRVFRNWINPNLGKLALQDILGHHIADCLKAITDGGAPTVANDALRHIKKVLAYGVSMGFLQTNVAEAITHSQVGNPERARERALSLDEIHTLLKCMEVERSWFGRDNELAIRLLLLLGLRKGELIRAKWSEIVFKGPVWRLPKERTKTGRSIQIPLPAVAVEHFEELQQRACGSEWVLPARRRGKRRLGHIGPDTLNSALQKLPHGLEDFSLHDLRRTMRTQLSALGVRPEVAERCLNHKLRGILGVYDRYDFLPERRAALDQWSQVIERLDADDMAGARAYYQMERVVKFNQLA